MEVVVLEMEQEVSLPVEDSGASFEPARELARPALVDELGLVRLELLLVGKALSAGLAPP